MKNILFILGISIVLFSCKKDKIGGFSTFTDCPGMYEYRSESLDLSVYDSLYSYHTLGCWGNEAYIYDTLYNNVVVNPNNPYEIAYVERIPQASNPYSLYTYNFCTGKKTLLTNQGITGENNISWSKKGYLFLNKVGVISKIKDNGTNLTHLFTSTTSLFPIGVYCNPSGTLFNVEYSDYPNGNINKIYTEVGSETFEFPNQSNFLGWYDDSHVLTSFDGQTIKTNVLTGNQEVFLSGEYYSYDHKTERFLKQQDSSAYQKWLITDENGGVINEMPYHYTNGGKKAVIMYPTFGLNNKIISGLTSQEFYPDKTTPSCGLLVRKNIIIMDMDGTNVRKVEFPE